MNWVAFMRSSSFLDSISISSAILSASFSKALLTGGMSAMAFLSWWLDFWSYIGSRHASNDLGPGNLINAKS